MNQLVSLRSLHQRHQTWRLERTLGLGQVHMACARVPSCRDHCRPISTPVPHPIPVVAVVCYGSPDISIGAMAERAICVESIQVLQDGFFTSGLKHRGLAPCIRCHLEVCPPPFAPPCKRSECVHGQRRRYRPLPCHPPPRSAGWPPSRCRLAVTRFHRTRFRRNRRQDPGARLVQMGDRCCDLQ